MLPSQLEAFSLAALEALAAKTPVISTNSGGTPELIIHNENGMLSNVGDVEDMANNAMFILKDECILNKFKESAYIHSKKFNIESILTK